MPSLGERALATAPATPWLLVAPGAPGPERWRFRPVVVLRLVILALLVAQLGRIPVLSTGDREAPLLVNDICILVLLATGFLAGLHARSFKIDSVGGAALAFAFLGSLSAVLAIPRFGLSGWQLVVSLAYLARWMVYFGVYLVVINIVRQETALDVWRALERTILMFAAFGIVQSIFLPHFAQLVYPDARVYVDWDEQGHRLVSTVLDPNLAGSMIMIVLLVHLAQLAGGEPVAAWKPMLLFAALVATLSRSSFLGLLVGGTMILAVRGVSRRLLRTGGLIAVLLLAASPQILAYARSFGKLGLDASALGRMAQWVRALTVFIDHPIIGIGFNTYAFVQEHYGYTRMGAATYSTDGGLLFVAVMTGLVGLALYLLMLALVIRRCRRVWRNPAAPAEWRAFMTGVAAATAAVCVHSIFVNSLLTPFVMEMLWVLWGLAFVIDHDTRANGVMAAGSHVVSCQIAA